MLRGAKGAQPASDSDGQSYLGKSLYRVFIKYCVFFRIFQNIPNSVFPRWQFVYTKQAGRKPALQQNWQSSEKSQNFKEKNTIFNEHPV